MPDLIDIWMPVYNAAETLPLALLSLQRQTHGDFRVIAVDDGSTDDSLDILEATAQDDPRIQPIARGHCGLIAALQSCASTSTAEWVARADADDIYHKRRLEEQLARIRAPDAPVLVGTRVAQFPGRLRGEGMRGYTQWVNSLIEHDQLARDRLIECPIVHTTFFFRRDAFDRAGGYRDISGPEDLDLIFRFVENGGRLATVPRIRSFWRLRESSLQKTDSRYRTEAFLKTKMAHLLRLGIIGRRPVVIWGQTEAGKWLARALSDNGIEVDAFVDLDPRKIGQRPYGIEVFDGRNYEPNWSYFHIGMVRNEEARTEFRDRMTTGELEEWENFVVMQ